MKMTMILQSTFGLIICASVLAGCSSPRKRSVSDTNPVSARAETPVTKTADVPASDSAVKMRSRKVEKSPVNLGAASSGQGL